MLLAVTVAVTVPLTMVGVPSAALFAALVVGIVLALAVAGARAGAPPAGIAAQGVLGVYIGTMVHHDALTALGSDWPIVRRRSRSPRWCSASSPARCSGCTATSAR